MPAHVEEAIDRRGDLDHATPLDARLANPVHWPGDLDHVHDGIALDSGLVRGEAVRAGGVNAVHVTATRNSAHALDAGI